MLYFAKQPEKGGGTMPRINRGENVSVYFTDENAAPYRMFGKYVSMDDEWVEIIGTAGDYTGKRYFIPRSQIKMIEVVERRREDA
jgi:hypothetical protein